MENANPQLAKQAEKIRKLNDDLRQNLTPANAFMSRGIAARLDIQEVLAAIQSFNSFTNANDPHGEHDFGGIEFADDTVFWKIDYYANDMMSGSPDATDPDVTIRILTIMLAEEY